MAILSLQEAMEYLDKPDTSELRLIVDSVNQLIPELCWITFDLDDYTEKLLLRSPNLTLRLSHFPVVTLTSLTNLSGTAVTPLIEDFENGILRLKSDYWGGVTNDDDEFDVVYSAGYTTTAQKITSTYVSGTQFTIVGDVTMDYIIGATLNADCGADGILEGTISGSAYSSPNTTVDCSDAAFTANMLTTHITCATFPSTLKIAALAIIQDRLEIGDSSLTKQKLGDRSFERKFALPSLAQEIINQYSEITA
jgi:hypothetical protein